MKTMKDFMTSFKRRKELEATLMDLRTMQKIGDEHEDLIEKNKLGELLQKAEEEHKELQLFYDEWIDEEFRMTITIERENEDVTFTVISTGEFRLSGDGNRWLLCYNPNTGKDHYVRLIRSQLGHFIFDVEWMKKNRVYYVDYKNSEIDDGHEFDVMPCDENPEDCGLTCVNCSRGY